LTQGLYRISELPDRGTTDAAPRHWSRGGSYHCTDWLRRCTLSFAHVTVGTSYSKSSAASKTVASFPHPSLSSVKLTLVFMWRKNELLALVSVRNGKGRAPGLRLPESPRRVVPTCARFIASIHLANEITVVGRSSQSLIAVELAPLFK